MDDCVFCKIVNGQIASAKVWGDDKFLAFLDVNPNIKGMTLVIPRQHFDSYVFDMDDKDYCELLKAAQKVAKLLERGLGVQRVAMVMEGMGVNHAHIKLYPLYGLDEKFKETWAKEKIWFEKYEGYISTQLGPSANLDELNQLAKEIRGKE